ncbi:ABC transporter substrate-binding protein [Nonomuraea ferruginea]
MPVVKVGLIGPVTGAFAVAGISMENSVRVEIDRLNAEGGVGGAKLELVVRDTALDPAKGVQAANEFAGDDSVGLVIGPALSAFYNAAKPVLENAKKINCQPMVATGDFTSVKYGYRAQDPVSLDVQKIVEHLKAEGITSVGIVYEGDDAGKGTAAEIQKQAEAAGLTFAGFQETRNDDQSHRAYVENLKDSRRDLDLQLGRRRQDHGRRRRDRLQGAHRRRLRRPQHLLRRGGRATPRTARSSAPPTTRTRARKAATPGSPVTARTSRRSRSGSARTPARRPAPSRPRRPRSPRTACSPTPRPPSRPSRSTRTRSRPRSTRSRSPTRRRLPATPSARTSTSSLASTTSTSTSGRRTPTAGTRSKSASDRMERRFVTVNG